MNEKTKWLVLRRWRNPENGGSTQNWFESPEFPAFECDLASEAAEQYVKGTEEKEARRMARIPLRIGDQLLVVPEQVPGHPAYLFRVEFAGFTAVVDEVF